VRSWLLKYKSIVICLVLLSLLAVARVWYLNTIPTTAYTPDEASILLNAQLLAETGRDEWNQPWPVVFRSFGDSKLPGYLYSVWATGSLFGFSWQTVRVPSVVAGVFLPLAVWWLVRGMGGSKRAAWIASILLVASPWTWHYGTTGYEAHLALLFWIVAITVLIRRSANWATDLLAAVLIGITILTYNAPLLLLPALLLGVVAWRVARPTKALRGGMFLLVAGGLAAFVTLAASSQKGAISILQDPTLQAVYPEYRARFSGIFQTLLGNQWVYFAQHVVSRWFASWSWGFLVSRGGANPWHSIPGTGHLNGFILIVLGLCTPVWAVAVRRLHRVTTGERRGVLLALWLTLTATAPAVITVDAPHATRSLFFFVMLTVLAGWSLSWLLDLIQDEFPDWGRRVFWFVLAVVFFWQTVLWVSPAQVRWQYFVSPRWNTHLIETLNDPQVQLAERVYIVDPHGTIAAYVGVQDDKARENFATQVIRSQPDTIGLVRVEQLGKYFFIFQATDIGKDSTGVLLQPRSNTEWDIIEL
jgi:4-amino-4-deoxy-L-arabinose transferase-like glycosyltransferase